MEEIREECGVFGVFDMDSSLDVARMTRFALYGFQHRGQESCGIAVGTGKTILSHKDMGLVSEVFNEAILESLKGRQAIGHVRYSGVGHHDSNQPLVVSYRDGMIAIAHNGNLVNSKALRRDLANQGGFFVAGSDTELILQNLCRQLVQLPPQEAVARMMGQIHGSYATVALIPNALIGFRDPHGIRPLCLGKRNNAYMLSSESCVFDILGAEFVRDVAPGEIIIIDKNGLRSLQAFSEEKTALCVFEFVYFARPDSYIDGASVHKARMQAGRRLAQEYPGEADLVIGAPDSALSAAKGYSRESGIPYGHGLIRNRYVGRTFIQPTQEMRDAAVRLKFSALAAEIEGKRLVMVDDSIVRGTTTRLIVQMLKKAGAKEVHLRISSPPVKFPCFYGIDTATTAQLVASRLSVKEIREMIGADSLGYLSHEGLMQIPQNINCGLCDACFTGKYIVPPKK